MRHLRHLRSRPVLIVLAFLVLNAAAWVWVAGSLRRADLSIVRIVAATPAGDADGAERLTLLFDRPIGAVTEGDDEEARRPDLFRIEPAAPGRFEWATADRLEYVLAEPLPPGREWEIVPVDDFAALTGRSLEHDDPIRFRTKALALGRSVLSPLEDESVSLSLSFNQPVLPREVLASLTLHDPLADADLDAESLGRDPALVVAFRLHRPAGDKLAIRLAADLAGHGGERPLGREILRTLDLPRSFGLVKARFHSFHTGQPRPDRATATLDFSSRLDRTGKPPRIEVDPEPADFSVRWGTQRASIALVGEFRPGVRYHFTVPAGVLAADGRALRETQTAVLEIPERKAGVNIPYWRGVLSPGGNLELDARLVNVSRLRVRAWRVHDNNLVPRLQGLRKSATSRELAARDIDVDLPRNRAVDVTLDLAGLLRQPLGLYEIRVDAPGHRWTYDSAIVAVTDLAVTAKRSRREISVWVTSLETGAPVPDAGIEVRSATNQSLAEGRTGSDGFATLPVAENHPDGKPWLVLARKGEDASHLRLDRSEWVLDDVDQSGARAPRGFDVFLYPERGVYRPGDTVHLTGIVRGPGGETPPDFPVELTVTRPDGVEAARLIATPGAQGVFHADYPTPNGGQTGPYRVKATLPGSGRVLGRTHALVEEFVPARIELTASPRREVFVADEEPEIEVVARYLFDQPAAGLPVAAAFTLRAKDYASGSLPDYSFRTTRPSERTRAKPVRAQLDADGRTFVALPLPEGTPMGRVELAITVTVTEPGSRSVSRNLKALVDRSPRHLGLRAPEGGFAPVERGFDVSWVSLTPDDRPAAPAPFTFALHSVRSDWGIREVDGRSVWRNEEHTALQTEGTLDPETASGSIPVVCPEAGRYRLLVTDVETGIVTKLDFYAAESAARARAMAADSPERVELVLDRERYEPGATATLLVRSPFAGKLLLTIEANRVLWHEVRDVGAGGETMEFRVPDSVRGGGYLLASVVRPLDLERGSWLPHRARGIARLDTTHESRRLAVTIEAPAVGRPGRDARVAVRVEAAEPGAVVHLWAVDEGILLSGATKTPDPHGHFFRRRRLEVGTRDVFTDLLPDHLRPAGTTRIGGDGGAARLRRNPVPTRRRDAAVTWLASVPVDETGRVELDLPTPDLTGAIRLMATAVSGDRYGSAERRLVLRDEISIEAGWPGFLAPGDRALVPFKVFNRTAEPLLARFTLRAEGAARLADAAAPDEFTVAPGGTMTLWREVEGAGIGPATLTASVSDGVRTAEAAHDLPVRPAGPLHTETRLLRTEAGGELVLEPSADFLPGARRRLEIAAVPEVELRPALERLLDYPHGCVEQTTSRLTAILHAPDLMPTGPEGEGARADLAREMIAAGISRLLTMQTRSGGLAYWPGGGTPHPFGTAYAASFLAEAARDGHPVPGSFLDPLLAYLDMRLRDEGSPRNAPNEAALLCRVLAAFDRPPESTMARLSERTEELDMAGRAHLASAWFDAGRQDRALAALTEGTLSLAAPTTLGGRITSAVRQEGVLLSTLLRIAPEHAWVPALVRRLTAARKNGAWRSTLEDAAALEALLRYQVLARDTREPAHFDVTVRCGEERYQATHEAPFLIDLPAGDEPVRIESRGTGTIFLTLRTEGLARADRVTGYDRTLRVRRRWFAASGAPLDPATVRVGDLVRVEVTLSAPQAITGRALLVGRSFPNVAIVDALPAGFEIENPRLATSAQGGRTSYSMPDRAEFLADRVVLFSSALSGPRTFGYAIRAVKAGRFVAPPIQASCMYDPEYASVHGGGSIEVAR